MNVRFTALTVLLCIVAYAETSGQTMSSPPSKRCLDGVDTMDLASDNLYYVFSGPNFYTIEKSSGAMSANRPINAAFSEVVPPIKGSFSLLTGQTSGNMYLIDSDPINNVKIFNVSSNDVLPRQPTSSKPMAKTFPDASATIPQPLHAALATSNPSQVYFFGGPSSTLHYGVYNYNVNTSAFTSRGPAMYAPLNFEWANASVTSAVTYFHPSNGRMSYFLFSAEEVVRVDQLLQITAGPAQISSCPSWLRTPTSLAQCCKTDASLTITPLQVTTPQPSLSGRRCDGEDVDAIDAAPNRNLYFFKGQYLFISHSISGNMSGNISKPVTISSMFSSITLPVVAVFSTGPLNPRMYIIDSAPINNMKMYKFDSPAIPRIPLKIGAMDSFFPYPDRIPQPLTAAMAIREMGKVYLFGGPPNNRSVVVYRFNSALMSFLVDKTTTLTIPKEWPNQVISASEFTRPQNFTSALYLFHKSQMTQVDSQLKVLNGPAPAASCLDWMGKSIENICCRTQVAATHIPLQENVSRNTSTDASVTP